MFGFVRGRWVRSGTDRAEPWVRSGGWVRSALLRTCRARPTGIAQTTNGFVLAPLGSFGASWVRSGTDPTDPRVRSGTLGSFGAGRVRSGTLGSFGRIGFVRRGWVRSRIAFVRQSGRAHRPGDCPFGAMASFGAAGFVRALGSFGATGFVRRGWVRSARSASFGAAGFVRGRWVRSGTLGSFGAIRLPLRTGFVRGATPITPGFVRRSGFRPTRLASFGATGFDRREAFFPCLLATADLS